MQTLMNRRVFPWFGLALTTVVLGTTAVGVRLSVLLVPLLVLS
ncbi:MAG: hypothetical protein ACM4D3_04870 [Candidatus Sericytochromatia bacterium]